MYRFLVLSKEFEGSSKISKTWSPYWKLLYNCVSQEFANKISCEIIDIEQLLSTNLGIYTISNIIINKCQNNYSNTIVDFIVVTNTKYLDIFSQNKLAILKKLNIKIISLDKPDKRCDGGFNSFDPHMLVNTGIFVPKVALPNFSKSISFIYCYNEKESTPLILEQLQKNEDIIIVDINNIYNMHLFTETKQIAWMERSPDQLANLYNFGADVVITDKTNTYDVAACRKPQINIHEISDNIQKELNTIRNSQERQQALLEQTNNLYESVGNRATDNLLHKLATSLQ